MKRYVSFLLAVVLCFAFCSVTYAAPDDGDTYVNEPVLDYEFLSSAYIREIEGNVVITKNTQDDPQGRSNLSTGKQESVILVPSEDSSAEDILSDINSFLLLRTNGSKYEEEEGASASVRLYSTIYYSRKTENNKKYIVLTKVTGGVKILDSLTSIVSQNLTMGTSDYTISQAKEVYPTQSSFSYSAPSSWEYIEDNTNFGGLVGATYKVEARRGTSTKTWTVSLINRIL